MPYLLPVQFFRVGVFFFIGRFLSRLGVGVFFVLLVLHLVSLSFPGFRLFLVFPLVRDTSVFHGVRTFFFVFLIVGYLFLHRHLCFRYLDVGILSILVLVLVLLALLLSRRA